MDTEVVNDFIAAINQGNIDKIYGLMSDDHLFVDSQDNRIKGREMMRQAWLGYFDIFPDYKIEINEILKNEQLVCIIGYASGTYKNLKNESNTNYWRIPAAWAAIVREDKISYWQVYADNIKVMEIINKNLIQA